MIHDDIRYLTDTELATVLEIALFALKAEKENPHGRMAEHLDVQDIELMELNRKIRKIME